jgi:hypothetical protein
MATLPYLGQVPAQWFNLAGDAALAGGTLYFYEPNTSTPKEVFADYEGNTSAGTSVTLNSTGRANVFTDGLYRVILRDEDGVQIGPTVDGIGSAAGVDTGSVQSVETYNDLRDLTGANATAVVVEGRLANGDGGAGLFVWDALETAADDGGALLTPTSNPASGRWVRIFTGDMDLRWWGGVLDNATDDAAAYASALAASVSRERWLGIFGGTARLASTVSAPSGSMVRFSRGGALTATSGSVSAGFPTGSTLEGSYHCFKGSLVVSIAQEAAWQIDPDWWDSVDDDARILAACDACASANQRVLIRHAYAMTADFTQPTNAVLVFEGSGKLAWTGATAVDVVLRKFTSGDPTGGRVTFSSVAKLASLTMVDNQADYLSPFFFGAAGDGSTDDAAAVWPVVLHGKGRIDARFKVGTTLAKTGAVDLRGPIVDGRDFTTSDSIPAALVLSSGVDLTASGALTLAGCAVIAKNAAQSEIVAGDLLTMDASVLWGQENTGVASLGVQATTATICKSLLTTAPVHAPNSRIADSVVEGSGTYAVTAVDQVGLGGGGWTILSTEIAEAATLGIKAIRGSSIVSDYIAWPDGAECVDSTVAPLAATSYAIAVGGVLFNGGRVTMPLVADEDSVIQVTGVAGPLTAPAFGYSEMAWNGLGILDVAGTPGAEGSLLSPRHAMRPCARSVDGVMAPRYKSSALDAETIPTSVTTDWAFGTSSTPSVVDDAFVWAGGGLSSSPATITRTFTGTSERILAAYGGIVVVDFTGGIEGVRILTGDEDIALLRCPGATSQRMAFHVWPATTAASAPVLAFELTHDGSGGTFKATVIPCAPLDSRQWVEFWGGDRTLTATTYNTWKETLDDDGDCVSLSVWCDTLPASPYTPRPETIQPALYDFAPEVRIFPKTLGSAATNPFMSAKAPSAVNFYSYLSTRG